MSPNPVTGVRRPTDRLAPGKGIVKWKEMLGLLAQKNYTGYLSYEAPNPELWERDPARWRARASSSPGNCCGTPSRHTHKKNSA